MQVDGFKKSVYDGLKQILLAGPGMAISADDLAQTLTVITASTPPATLAAPELAITSGPSSNSPLAEFDFPGNYALVAGTVMTVRHANSPNMASAVPFTYTLTQQDIDNQSASGNGIICLNLPNFTFANGDHYFDAGYQEPYDGQMSFNSAVVGPHIIDSSTAETISVTTGGSDLTPALRLTAGGTDFAENEALQFRVASDEAMSSNLIVENATAIAGATFDHEFSSAWTPALHRWVQGRRVGHAWSKAVQHQTYSPISIGPAGGAGLNNAAPNLTNQDIGPSPTGETKRYVMVTALINEFGAVGYSASINGIDTPMTIIELGANHYAMYALVEVPAGTTMSLNLTKAGGISYYNGELNYLVYSGSSVSLGTISTGTWETPTGLVRQLTKPVAPVPGGHVLAACLQGWTGSFRSADPFTVSGATKQFHASSNQLEAVFADATAIGDVTVTSTLSPGESYTVNVPGVFFSIQGI